MKVSRLRKGDTIGIISPASPEKLQAIAKGIQFIKDLGFNVLEGKHLYDNKGYLAGEDIDRAEDLMDMFKNNSVKMVLCIRGGYGVMRMLDYLDLETLKNNAKIFMGFSDITPLLNIISSKCGFITFHGPMGSSQLEDSLTLESFLYNTMEATAEYDIASPLDKPLISEIGGIAEGILVGGNLSLICATIGTPYEIEFKDKILLIEEVNEEPYAIDRLLTQLLLAGKLQQCSGFILGQFNGCTLPHYDRSLTLEEVFKDRIYTLNKPTISNFQTGHDYPKLTVPIGALVRLDSINCKITVKDGVLI